MSSLELPVMTGIRDAALRMWEFWKRAARRDATFVEVVIRGPSGWRSLKLVADERTVRLATGFDADELRRLVIVFERPR